jgi:putative ABC transport system ATP-binding protein
MRLPDVHPILEACGAVGAATEPPAAQPAVVAVDLVKTYGAGEAAVTALDGVSVSFTTGRFSAIMGPSGSGKSTLLHCLAGLDSVDAGQVLVGGNDLTRLGDRQLTRLRRSTIGIVFQAFNLLPTLTAAENIELPLRIAGRHTDQDWVDSIVGTLGLGDRLHHRPSELSGGQQQRVAIARALVTQPVVVFADEPTGNLDSRSSEELLRLLRHSVSELGQTIVMVTHDPVAAAYADEVVFLADGQLAGKLDSPTVSGVLDHLGGLERGSERAR